MFKKIQLTLAFAAMFCLIAGTAYVAFAAEEYSLEGVKCLLVSKKDAKEEKSSKWKDGKVFFCCDGCLGKFERMDDDKKEEIAPTANHQLVATKQYEQGACPFSGRAVTEGKMVEVKGVEVGFCCGGCVSKAEGMKEDKLVAACFGEDAFEKGEFAPTKHDDE